MEKTIDKSVHGLKYNCLSFPEIIAQSFAGIAPTTVPAAVLGSIFALSGNGTWLSFLLGLVGLLFVSTCINQFASRSASPGSLYSYICNGLGSTAGVICGWSMIFAYLFTGMSVLCGISNLLSNYFGLFGYHSLGLNVLILVLVSVLCWYIAYRDIQLSAVAMLWTEITSIVLILILCAIIWFHKGFALDISQLSLKGVNAGNIASGLVLVMFGFSGFESATSLGDEAQNPLKTIPKALTYSTLISGAFFLITAYIVILGFQETGADLAKTDAPLAFLANRQGLGILGQAVSIGAFLSFFAGLLGTINPAARIVFTMSQYGLFPASLGSAHCANRTPHNALTLCSILVFIVPLAMTVNKIKLFESMGYMGTIASFGFLTVYILIALASPVYLSKIGKLRPKHILFSSIAIMFMLFPILGSIGIQGSSWFPVPDYPNNLFPYIFLAYLVITTLWFAIQRSRFPDLADKMLVQVEKIHQQFKPYD